MKILLILSTHEMNMSFVDSVKTIKLNIIDSLIEDGNSVDIFCVSSNDDHDNYKEVLGNIKFKIKSNERQFLKIVQVFKYLDSNNIEDYDWYIKVRPDLTVNEKIDNQKMDTFNKNAVNSRVRFYLGPEINIPYGTAYTVDEVWKHSWSYSETINSIVPDDQIYFFHTSIAKKAFAKIQNSEIKSNKIIIHCLPLSPPNKIWLVRKFSEGEVLLHGLKQQTEFFHRDMFNIRNITIQPTSLNVTLNGVNKSDNLIIKR
jgi:hypothetical protein